jgi:hypothetical protein
LDRKLGCVDAVKERVKQELGDEELDDLLWIGYLVLK